MKCNLKFVDVLSDGLTKSRKKYNFIYKFRLFLIKWLPVLLLLLTSDNILFVIFGSIMWFLFATIFFDHKDIQTFEPKIRLWFGVPGSGKTTMAAWLTLNSRRLHYNVLSNVQIKGSYRLESTDLGEYDTSFGGQGAHIVYDEGSIDFDNRNYKEFVKTNRPKYFALHRHMHNMVDVFSQGYDIDKRIRDRCGQNGLYYLKKLNLKGFVCYRRIKKVLFINKEDKQIVDGFEFKGLPRLVYVRDLWSSFDTLDKSLCPTAQKEWKKW